jgi:hypothetical protein
MRKVFVFKKKLITLQSLLHWNLNVKQKIINVLL